MRENIAQSRKGLEGKLKERARDQEMDTKHADMPYKSPENS